MQHLTTRHTFLILLLAVLAFAWLVPSIARAQDRGSELLAQVEALKSVAEQYRGLEFLHDVPVELLDQDEAAELISGLIDDEMTAEMNESYTNLYILLGLLPRGSDFLDTYKTMIEEQVAGLYDPDTKKFYVVDMDIADMYSGMLGGLGDIPGVGSLMKGLMNSLYPGLNDVFGEAIIVHEMTHALDDQHFDIGTRSDELMEENSDDAALAYQSLLEGSATLTMNRYQLDAMENFGFDSDMMESSMSMDIRMTASMLDYDPLVERLSLIPYLKGLDFLRIAYDRGGTAAVDEVFNSPPVSMEQIYHPAKYFNDPDAPSYAEPIDLSGVLKDWELDAEDTLGEALTELVFEFNTGDIQLASDAAVGWDYDFINTWRSPSGDLAFSWISVWDTESDSSEFFEGYKQVLEAKYPEGEWKNMTDTKAMYTGLGLAAALEVRDKVVVIIEGVPEDEAGKCLEQAWKSDIEFKE